ncbi:MAG: magnesium/cobalt transporter CorA [Desulfopila sp.]
MRKKQKKKKAKRQSATAGLAPGTPVFLGEQKTEKIRIDAINYSELVLTEFPDTALEQCSQLLQKETVTWLNVNGIHDIELIEAIGKRFNLHPLTLEDLVNTNQRPKAEVFPHYLFIVLKMMSYNEAAGTVDKEHVSLILGENFVISFIEDAGDVFNTVRERLKAAKGRIRSMPADYLAYALMDAIVDHYFLAVEHLGDVIEEIDDRLLSDPRPDDIQEIHRLKREILGLRKAVWPLREVVGALDKSESPHIHQETLVFLRDLYDHTVQVIDMVETSRDLLGGMHDTYLSSVSNRMNEIMKVLTIIATIFIPLTFIAGVYGMNFEHMPELKWPWGYALAWLVMGTIACGMIVYFKRKKWL